MGTFLRRRPPGLDVPIRVSRPLGTCRRFFSRQGTPVAGSCAVRGAVRRIVTTRDSRPQTLHWLRSLLSARGAVEPVGSGLNSALGSAQRAGWRILPTIRRTGWPPPAIITSDRSKMPQERHAFTADGYSVAQANFPMPTSSCRAADAPAVGSSHEFDVTCWHVGINGMDAELGAGAESGRQAGDEWVGGKVHLSKPISGVGLRAPRLSRTRDPP